MTTPTKMTQTYGPITEIVKNAKGHIRHKRGEDFVSAIADCGETLAIKRFPPFDLPAARQWVRDTEASLFVAG